MFSVDSVTAKEKTHQKEKEELKKKTNNRPLYIVQNTHPFKILDADMSASEVDREFTKEGELTVEIVSQPETLFKLK